MQSDEQRPIGDFIAKTPGNGKFLYSAYGRFSNVDLLELLRSWGMETVTERGGRVFPKSEDAQEVRHLFMRKLEETGYSSICPTRCIIS